MAHIFISYSSKHRDLTEHLAALLKNEGYPVWWDYDLESWGAFQTQIDNALKAASVVVVIWSSGAADSTYVLAEANRALESRKLVNARAPDFPVSAVPPPYNALHVDTLDLAEPHRLLRSIRGVRTGKPLVTAKPLHEHYQDAFGVMLFDPKREPLNRDASELGPSELLQARHEAVPYIDSTGLAEEMLGWCRDRARTTAGRLIHGPGGFGKTRLTIETARRLRAEDWLAGFLQPPRHAEDIQEIRQREQALEQVFLLGEEPGVLLVVDYAEARQQEVAVLAKMLTRRPRTSGPPARLVLLARGDGWWNEFYQQTDGVEPVFRVAGKTLGDVCPLAPIPAGKARTDFFARTVTAFKPIVAAMARAGSFAGWDGQPPRQDRMVRLMQEPAYARPLAIQMEALLHLTSALPGPGAQGVDALLSRVLELEKVHWQRVLGPLDDDRKRDISRGTAQVTAVQGVNGATSAERLLMADDFYKGVRTARVHVDPVRRSLARVYGRSDGGIGQLEPDLIGEHHVASAADTELIEGCLHWIEGEPQPDRAARRHAMLRVLQHATQPEHGMEVVGRARSLIDHLVCTQLPTLGVDVVSVIRDTPGALIDRVREQVPILDESALAALDSALPLQSFVLMDLSLAVAEKREQLARQQQSTVDAGNAPETQRASEQLAARLGTLGVRLSDLGRREEALAASQEAVDIYRALAKERPDAFRPDLAMSLNNLGNRLSNLNRWKEALAASQEAVDIRRPLAKDRPDAFRPDLAMSLNNLGNDLSNIGRREEALAASQEAVDIYRALAKDRPDAFRPDLAMSLNNLGILFFDPDLAAAARGNAHRRQNDAENKDRYHLFQQPSRQGVRDSRWSASILLQEAVDIYRALAKERPDAFRPNLAASLNNLGILLHHRTEWDETLADADRRSSSEEALAASQEAVDVYRALAKERPNTFRPDLVMCLVNLAECLSSPFSHLNSWKEAQAACGEAVDINRALAKERPDAFRPNLESSLPRGIDPESLRRDEIFRWISYQ
jgi:tetratricopeptide (TPR) repeat protein